MLFEPAVQPKTCGSLSQYYAPIPCACFLIVGYSGQLVINNNHRRSNNSISRTSKNHRSTNSSRYSHLAFKLGTITITMIPPNCSHQHVVFSCFMWAFETKPKHACFYIWKMLTEWEDSLTYLPNTGEVDRRMNSQAGISTHRDTTNNPQSWPDGHVQKGNLPRT